jgi:hypothetical protein
MNTRAKLLADRIEQGAENLAAFAEGLSEAEWYAVVPPDGRTAGVIIHHVASVYPVEIHLTREIAAGRSISGLTWDDVAEMNAKHAEEYKGQGKKETIELLRSNSRAAAEAIRNLTDEQLDRAMPVSLNADAPLTAQFIIEDHAVRHSWHHLAKIRAVIAGG